MEIVLIEPAGREAIVVDTQHSTAQRQVALDAKNWRRPIAEDRKNVSHAASPVHGGKCRRQQGAYPSRHCRHHDLHAG